MLYIIIVFLNRNFSMNQTATSPDFEPTYSTVEAEHYADDQERQQHRQHIEHLEDQITELAAHIHAATYRLLELIREYDACDGWSAPGLRSCAHWLNWKCGIDMGAAREKVRVAQAYGSKEENAGNGGDRFLVHVHTDVETLKSDGTGAQAELENFGHVAAETSRRLACDAGVVHWLDGAGGQPLSVGRKTRSIPPAIRRALQRRDGGCRFPGCTCSRFVDAHHIRHWADGGETSLENLALLCRRHHRLVHEGGFAMRASAHGTIEFTNPAGAVIPTGPETRCRGNVFALFSAHEQLGIHITPDTTIPDWYGEKMDDELAVLGMLQLE
jgi:hypothetical protein